MTDLFRDPSPDELQSYSALVGTRISIWWDGDNVFYPCKVVEFDDVAKQHVVKYDNDENGSLSSEILGNQPWKVWEGTDEEFDAYNDTNKMQQIVRKLTFLQL